MITIDEYIKIPLVMYAEMQLHLMPGSGPDGPTGSDKIRAIKVLRYSTANIAREDDMFQLKQCKQIIDWISNNPGGVFINSESALIPASILE